MSLRKVVLVEMLLWTSINLSGCAAVDCEGDLSCLEQQAYLEALGDCQQELWKRYGDAVRLGFLDPMAIDQACRDLLRRNKR